MQAHNPSANAAGTTAPTWARPGCAVAARATCTAAASRGAMLNMPKVARWFGLAVLVIVLDYLTKIAVLASFAPGESRALAPFFNLVLVFNKGAAFSFLASAQGWQTLLFAAIAIAASVAISFLIIRNKSR